MIRNRPAQEIERITAYIDSDLEEIVPGFLENRRGDVQTIAEALERGDYETIQVLGHRMKGSGGGYGFDPISDIGRSLEEASKERDRQVISVQVGNLSTYLDRVDVVYE